MAEKGTETGTPQHKKKAREQGDSVRSRELLSAVALLAGLLTLGMVSHHFVASWRVSLLESLDAALADEPTSELHWADAIRRAFVPMLLPLATVMGASFLGALATGIAQGGGVQFHPNALSLRLSKLNPVTNLGNLFSLRGLTRVAKSILPALIMVLFGWKALQSLLLPYPVMSLARLPFSLQAGYSLALDAAVVSLIWSGLDYAIEWVSWNSRMKMTKQQLRDELKETLGNPQVKGRIRQIQNAMRRRKVKADMSRASVVITNPTHYAVALEFSFETMTAPTVLAKGAIFMRLRSVRRRAGRVCL